MEARLAAEEGRYFCTSKASKARTFVLVKQVKQANGGSAPSRRGGRHAIYLLYLLCLLYSYKRYEPTLRRQARYVLAVLVLAVLA